MPPPSLPHPNHHQRLPIDIDYKYVVQVSFSSYQITRKNIHIYHKESLNVNHFLVVNVRTAERAPRGGDQSTNAALTVVPPFNSMPSHESRLVIRRGPDVAHSHPPCVAFSAVLTFTTKKWFTFEPDPIYIFKIPGLNN